MPAKRTDPGQLRHRLMIERRQAGQDALGQPVETWEPVATIWAAQLSLGKAGEQVLAGRPVESYAVRYRIRAQDAVRIQPGDRASVDGKLLKILAAPPASGEVGGQWVDVVGEVHNQ